MGLDIVEGKTGVARRLRQPPAEIAHDVGIDEVVMRQHSRDAFLVQVGREQFGQRGGDGLERCLVADEMHIGVHGEPRRRQDALGRFHIGAVQPQSLGQLEPALDAALGSEIAVMILDSMTPFEPDAAVAKARDHDGILDRNGALVIIAVQRPGLHLPLVQLAAVQQPVKWMQTVIARRADVAECGFKVFGACQRGACTKREGCHGVQRTGVQSTGVQSTISIPSVGICQPACSAVLRSAESRSSTGLELLICRNIFLSISRSARAAIAPESPDIAICPMPCPVLLPRPAAINSSSRQTVPSKKIAEAPASRVRRSLVTPAQAARKYMCLPLAASPIRSPRVSPAPSSPAGWTLPSRYHALLPDTANGRISMPEGAPSGSAASNALSISIGWRRTFFSFSTLKMLLVSRIASTLGWA